MRPFLLLLAGLATVAPIAAFAQGGRTGGLTWANDFASPSRLKNFRNGLNVVPLDGGWADQGFTIANGRLQLPDNEIAAIKTAGFDHVRVVFGSEGFWTARGNPALNETAMAALKDVTSRILATGLNVVICPGSHYAIGLYGPSPDGYQLCRDLLENPAGGYNRAKFAQWWTNFGNSMKAESWCTTGRVWFELLGEPRIFDPAITNDLYATVFPPMRAALRNFTIVLDGSPYAAVNHFAGLNKMNDSLELWSFHFYGPYEFGTQGGVYPWAAGTFADIWGIPWGITNAQVVAYMNAWTPPGYGTISATTNFINKMRTECRWWSQGIDWNITGLRSLVAEAVDWAKLNRVALWCGEYGITNPSCAQSTKIIPEQYQSAWTHDATTAVSEQGIGVCQWMYQFLCTGQPGQRVLQQSKVGWINIVR